MQPFLVILLIAVIGLLIILLLSVVLSIIMLATARRQKQKELEADSKSIRQQLCGQNCGRCGCNTCNQFANLLAEGAASADTCPELTEETLSAIGMILQQRQEETNARVALLESEKSKQRKTRLGAFWVKK